MRAIASLLLVGLLSATPVLAQIDQETARPNRSCISSTVMAPSIDLQSWTPSLAPTNAADLMVMPLAERLAFTTAAGGLLRSAVRQTPQLDAVTRLEDGCNQLVSIFVGSVKTARRPGRRPKT